MSKELRAQSRPSKYSRPGKTCYRWRCPRCGRWRSCHATQAEVARLPRICKPCLEKPETKALEDRSLSAHLPDIRVAVEVEGKKRLRAFSRGWNDAVERGQDYTGEEYVTWQNLGHRLGHAIGPASSAQRAAIYHLLVEIQKDHHDAGIREHPERETT